MNTKVDLFNPPAYGYEGPIIDAHCHSGNVQSTELMLEAGKMYGVGRWVVICDLEEVAELREKFADQLEFNIWLDHTRIDDRSTFVNTNLGIIEEAARRNCACIKFWYKPEFNRRSGFFFDDPKLDPIFEAMVEAGLPGLVHIADPDVWWTHRYHDPDQYEAKRFTYRQLTNTLGRFPNLRLLVAHMGGWPENLEFLDRLLQHYPNCYFDTSGTKWIARELSVQAEEARKFIVRYADRLLFGSDLVARSRLDLAHYCSRYWVHRHLYEKNHRVLSPIKDPDAPGAVNVAGLDLPEDVLKRLYVENARRFYGLERT